MKKIIILSALVLTTTACNEAPPPADSSVITSRSDVWEQSLNAKDLDTLVGLYTTDARLMPPGGETMTGHDAVRTAFGGMMDAGIGGELTTVQASVAGDIGYNVGTFNLTSGGEVIDTGKFVELWQRGADGEWRIAGDIWNSDGAMAAAGDHHTHMVFVHPVADAGRWLAAWRGENSRAETFKANGAAHVHTFQSSSDPNLTALVVAVEDRDALQAFIESEEGAAAAAEDGADLEAMTVFIQTE